MLKLSDKIGNATQYVAERIIILCFSVMVLSVFATVISRNAGVSLHWLDELARYMQIWVIGVGFAVALRVGLMSGTEILLHLLPRRAAKAAIVAVKLIMLWLCVLMLKFSLPLIALLFDTGQLSASMQIPVVYIYLGLYLGFALSVVFIITSLISNTFGRRDSLDATFAQLDDLPRAS